MVLATNQIISPRILFLSNDIEIRSEICNENGLSDYEMLFLSQDDNIPVKVNGYAPGLAVLDARFDIERNSEIIKLLKKQYNIPVILLIDPAETIHLELATRCEVDSIITKPFQSQQLSVSIQYYLLLAKNKRQFCVPKRCGVITHHIKDLSIDQNRSDSANLLDNQDFIQKIKSLINQTQSDKTTNVCATYKIFDKRMKENPHWKNEYLNLINLLGMFIKRQIRFGDILARGSDNNYLILFPDMDKYTASHVIKRINNSILEFINDFDKNSGLSVSAGATVFDENSDVVNILDNMDLALNEACKMGNSAFVINSMLDSRCEKNIKKVSYANMIQNALREDAFFLHYQPIISLSDNSVRHYEALLRLFDHNGEFVSPRNIISVAENNHQIKDIDIRILDLVMRKIVSTQLMPEDFKISVNLSGTHFGDEGLLQDICAIIDYYGIDPSHLVFEMTETAAVKDMKKASVFISKLKDLGCRFGLDDFGTGYASFSYLRALPVDYLKIDGTFIKEIIHNSADQLFVKAIVDVARGINVKTIAECVENKETLDMLISFGVDFAQGFYIGRPESL